MKTRIFLVAAALMIFASLSFGQGFNVFIYNDDNPLTQPDAAGGCNGAPWPDGTTVWIYHDADNDGPDADDQLASVGDQAGQVNYNNFPINGGAAFGVPGTFVVEVDFTSTGDIPRCGNPPVACARFYLVVNCPNGPGRNWTSNVQTFTSGPQEWDVNTWVCGACSVVEPCTPTEVANIQAEGSNVPHNISVCLDLCATHTTIVRICGPGGGRLDPSKPPVSTVRPGCLPPYCDVNCDPSSGIQVLGPQYDPQTGCWVYAVTGTDGCACFTFEYFLAASIESFVGTAGDNQVALTWITASEASVNEYQIVRNGEVVGTVESGNYTSQHEYSYTDESAVNGTTYTYTLRVVNADNSVTETGLEVSATPSFGAAVITEYALHQNFPNPFNPATEIAYDVLNSNDVTLKVYNSAGQEVATLVNGSHHEHGRYVVNFDAGNLTSGLYFYTVKIGNEFSATKKMLLVK